MTATGMNAITRATPSWMATGSFRRTRGAIEEELPVVEQHGEHSAELDDDVERRVPCRAAAEKALGEMRWPVEETGGTRSALRRCPGRGRPIAA